MKQGIKDIQNGRNWNITAVCVSSYNDVSIWDN